jgi:hypothetical protein
MGKSGRVSSSHKGRETEQELGNTKDNIANRMNAMITIYENNL